MEKGGGKIDFKHVDVDDGFSCFILFINILVLRIPTHFFFDVGKYWLCESMFTLQQIYNNMGIDRKIQKKKQICLFFTFIIKIRS